VPTEKIQNEVFNVGYQNLSLMEIAKLVQAVVSREFPDRGEVAIVTTPSDDLRSYHINSDKIKKTLGFVPQYTVDDAIKDLCDAFRDGRLRNSMEDDRYFNVRRLKRLQAA
jgi:nucleoside-diphosphate-sugar epimerase